MDRTTYRQYIGARYVPKFFENSTTGDSTWASGTSYEPLTIVTWNQNSYTSKKVVPATVGAPNLNPEYWANTGNLNAEIQRIDGEISDINTDLTGIHDDIDDINDSLSEAQSDIVNIEEDVTDVKKKIDKVYIFVGDSYGYAGGNGWGPRLKTLMGLDSTNCYETYNGGSGFCTDTASTFLQMLQNLASSISDKNIVTDILVIGGVNDWSHTVSEISTAIKNFNTYAKTTFPNSIVRLGCTITSNKSDWIVPYYSNVMQGYCDCGSAVFLNNIQYCLHNRSLVSSDGIHPTNEGYQILAEKIYDALNGGCSVYYKEFNIMPTAPSGSVIAPTDPVRLNVVLENGVTTIWGQERFGRWADGQAGRWSLTNGTACILYMFESDLFIAPAGGIDRTYNPFKTPCTAWVSTSTGFYEVVGYMVLNTATDSNVVTVSFTPYDVYVAQHTSDFASVGTIQIFGVSWTAPSSMC